MKALALALVFAQSPAPSPQLEGKWDAWLESPGGRIALSLELAHAEGAWSASWHNGSETIVVPEVKLEGAVLTLSFPHYDSSIEARFDESSRALDGTWSKRSGPERWTKLAFHAARATGASASAATEHEPRADAPSFAGRWAARFSSSEDPAVAILEPGPEPDSIVGTFLTTLGDYRYLAGKTDRERRTLVLSCFDGSHAFLFTAHIEDEGTLAGQFFSGDSWNETWTARRDVGAKLPDAFSLTHSRDNTTLAALQFPDLDGRMRSLADPAFAGKARIVQVFGSWCPNCNDEAPYLAELDQRYRARGLSIVGLAFELTGELERDTLQVRRYAERHGIRFPLLVAGISNKEDAARRLQILDSVRAYPTTLFLDSANRVRAIHTGYSGPATGAAHKKLREDFERLIEQLLAESGRR